MTGLPAEEEFSDNQPTQMVTVQYGAFYDRYVTPLVGFLICEGADTALAADVAQSTMRKAWVSWSTIEHPVAWARRTARNELTRRQKNNREVPGDPEVFCALLGSEDKAIGEFEQLHTIIWAVRQLPPRQREVLSWTILGYGPTEIAEVLDISAEAVRSSLKQARRKVIELLHGSHQEGRHAC